MKQIDGNVCNEVDAGGSTALLKTAMTLYKDYPEQLNQVGAAAGDAEFSLTNVRKALAMLTAAGYPKGFSIVEDLETYVPLYTSLIAAYRSGDLAPVPSIYLRLITADNQFVADADSAYHSGRDICTD